MPIIEPIADPNTPLCQGDILKGVCLFSTRKTWEPGGGEGHARNNSLCLILSRPCVALRSEWMIVAAIEKYKNRPGDFGSFDEAQQYFEEIRDGLTTPDQFYLGQLPNLDGSFCARFDSIHTVQLPPGQSGQRTDFITNSRVARLNFEFVHDLHLRHFRAFASLGFDDHRWFSTEDLRTFLLYAERDAAKKKADMLAAQAKLQAGTSQSFHHESDKKKLENEQRKCQQELEKILDTIEPYKNELALRQQPPTVNL